MILTLERSRRENGVKGVLEQSAGFQICNARASRLWSTSAVRSFDM